jgi:hypothetical protein
MKAKAFIVGEMIKEERKKLISPKMILLKKQELKKVIYPDLKMEKLISRFQRYLKYLKKDWEKN